MGRKNLDSFDFGVGGARAYWNPNTVYADGGEPPEDRYRAPDETEEQQKEREEREGGYWVPAEGGGRYFVGTHGQGNTALDNDDRPTRYRRYNTGPGGSTEWRSVNDDGSLGGRYGTGEMPEVRGGSVGRDVDIYDGDSHSYKRYGTSETPGQFTVQYEQDQVEEFFDSVPESDRGEVRGLWDAVASASSQEEYDTALEAFQQRIQRIAPQLFFTTSGGEELSVAEMLETLPPEDRAAVSSMLSEYQTAGTDQLRKVILDDINDYLGGDAGDSGDSGNGAPPFSPSTATFTFVMVGGGELNEAEALAMMGGNDREVVAGLLANYRSSQTPEQAGMVETELADYLEGIGLSPATAQGEDATPFSVIGEGDAEATGVGYTMSAAIQGGNIRDAAWSVEEQAFIHPATGERWQWESAEPHFGPTPGDVSDLMPLQITLTNDQLGEVRDWISTMPEDRRIEMWGAWADYLQSGTRMEADAAWEELETLASDIQGEMARTSAVGGAEDLGIRAAPEFTDQGVRWDSESQLFLHPGGEVGFTHPIALVDDPTFHARSDDLPAAALISGDDDPPYQLPTGEPVMVVPSTETEHDPFRGQYPGSDDLTYDLALESPPDAEALDTGPQHIAPDATPRRGEIGGLRALSGQQVGISGVEIGPVALEYPEDRETGGEWLAGQVETGGEWLAGKVETGGQWVRDNVTFENIDTHVGAPIRDAAGTVIAPVGQGAATAYETLAPPLVAANEQLNQWGGEGVQWLGATLNERVGQPALELNRTLSEPMYEGAGWLVGQVKTGAEAVLPDPIERDPNRDTYGEQLRVLDLAATGSIGMPAVQSLALTQPERQAVLKLREEYSKDINEALKYFKWLEMRDDALAQIAEHGADARNEDGQLYRYIAVLAQREADKIPVHQFNQGAVDYARGMAAAEPLDFIPYVPEPLSWYNAMLATQDPWSEGGFEVRPGAESSAVGQAYRQDILDTGLLAINLYSVPTLTYGAGKTLLTGQLTKGGAGQIMRRFPGEVKDEVIEDSLIQGLYAGYAGGPVMPGMLDLLEVPTEAGWEAFAEGRKGYRTGMPFDDQPPGITAPQPPYPVTYQGRSGLGLLRHGDPTPTRFTSTGTAYYTGEAGTAIGESNPWLQSSSGLFVAPDTAALDRMWAIDRPESLYEVHLSPTSYASGGGMAGWTGSPYAGRGSAITPQGLLFPHDLPIGEGGPAPALTAVDPVPYFASESQGDTLAATAAATGVSQETAPATGRAVRTIVIGNTEPETELARALETALETGQVQRTDAALATMRARLQDLELEVEPQLAGATGTELFQRVDVETEPKVLTPLRVEVGKAVVLDAEPEVRPELNVRPALQLEAATATDTRQRLKPRDTGTETETRKRQETKTETETEWPSRGGQRQEYHGDPRARFPAELAHVALVRIFTDLHSGEHEAELLRPIGDQDVSVTSWSTRPAAPKTIRGRNADIEVGADGGAGIKGVERRGPHTVAHQDSERIVFVPPSPRLRKTGGADIHELAALARAGKRWRKDSEGEPAGSAGPVAQGRTGPGRAPRSMNRAPSGNRARGGPKPSSPTKGRTQLSRLSKQKHGPR